MNTDASKKEITWETLNLCIGSIFELLENKRDFTTSDVAEILVEHGVAVIHLPKEMLN